MTTLRIMLLSLLLVSTARFATAQTADSGTSSGVHIKIVTTDSADDEDKDDHAGTPGKRHRHNHHNDRVSIGESVNVAAGETVGDAVSVGGSTTVSGNVEGDAVSVGGSLHVLPGAHVSGDAVVVGGGMTIDDGAQVDGERTTVGGPGLAALAGLGGILGASSLLWSTVMSLFSLLGLIAIGSLFVAFMPERIERMKDALEDRPVVAGGVGTLAFAGIVPATILLCITIIGILVVPFLWMLFGLVVTLGLAIVAQLIGERVLGGGRFDGPFVTLACGALLLSVAHLVPFVGFVVIVISMFVGTGAVLLSRGGSPRRSPPLPPDETPLPMDEPPTAL